MSKDTIYREDAIKAINARTDWYQVTCNGKQIAVMLMAKDVNKVLEAIPSADRPSGEWIDRGMRVPSSWVKKCSLCGHETDTWRWCKFCPNCGARMKGADDE